MITVQQRSLIFNFSQTKILLVKNFEKKMTEKNRHNKNVIETFEERYKGIYEQLVMI